MRFKNFRINNFKGIEHAEVTLDPPGANIFTFIGLNESGKTTILEAISVFGRASDDTKELYSPGTKKDDPSSFVPKHRKSNFSGDITVRAELQFEGNERRTLIEQIEKEHKCKLETLVFLTLFP
jgi:predicted ATP-dependent endonuclease of OLD family